jgi:endoglucanase
MFKLSWFNQGLKIAGACAALTALSQQAFAGCSYTIDKQWNTGFNATITITNTGSTAINGWSVNWSYSGNNRVSRTWNAILSGSNPYSARNESYNSTIAAGSSVSFGMSGSKSGGSAELVTVTGTGCGSVAASSSSVRSSVVPSSVPRSSVAPSSVPRSSTAPSSIPRSSSGTRSSTPTTSGTFRVDGSGNITKNGSVFPVRCGNWFGLEGQFEPKNAANNPGGAPMELFVGNMWWKNTGRTIQQTMTEIKAKGINMVRLPIAPQTLDPTNPQGIGDIRTGGVLKNSASVRQTNARQAMEDFIKLAAENGIQVLVDIHSCSNYIGWRAGVLDAKPPYVDANRPNYDFTREEWSCSATGNPSSVTNIQAYNETKWLANIRDIAGLPAKLGVNNIIGIDIFNEPWGYSWNEWKTLSEKAYAAMNSVNSDMLIFVEGVSGSTVQGNQEPHGDLSIKPNWGENFFGLRDNPLAIPKERLVLSPHTYGPSVFVQNHFLDRSKPGCADAEADSAAEAKCNIVYNVATLRAGWEEHFGKYRAEGYAMVVGEFGGNMDWPKKTTPEEEARWSHITTKVDQQWQNHFVDYMKEKNIQACYWAINPESGDTAGWYLHAFNPVSNAAGFGQWNALDARKTTLLQRLWGL